MVLRRRTSRFHATAEGYERRHAPRDHQQWHRRVVVVLCDHDYVSLATDILGVTATGAAAVAAMGSWRAAVKSNAAAASLLAIEDARRHDEMKPMLRVDCQRRKGWKDDALLRITLEGPAALGRLDEVRLKILDEMWRDRSGTPLGPMATIEEVKATIWGPYRFRPGVDQTADALGRTASGGPLDLATGTNWILQTVEPSQPPHWVSDADWWRREHQDQPIRLLVTCVLEGERPWEQAFDVQVVDQVF